MRRGEKWKGLPEGKRKEARMIQFFLDTKGKTGYFEVHK